MNHLSTQKKKLIHRSNHVLSSSLRIFKIQLFSNLYIFIVSFQYLSCVLSQQEVRSCGTLFRCGNITAGFPFWGEDRVQPCGHPSLGLRCHGSSTSLIISGLMYRVLNVTASTLKLARQDFSGNFCSASFSGVTLTRELFELLPEYKTLSAYYLCNPHLHYPANFTCPQKGPFSVGSVHQNDDYHKDCGGSFNITVPMSYVPEEKYLNITHLESVLRKGFMVNLKIDERPCQECKSSGGSCGYDVSTPVCCKTSSSSSDIKCNRMIPSGFIGFPLSKRAKIGIEFACGFLGSVAVSLVMFKAFSLGLCKRETSPNPRDHNLKALLQLKQYSYAELKKITKSFSHTVGKGGFGTVYGGNLCGGRKVAVKILKDLKNNGEDFINEVASMSQTSHVNIVSLLGFCYEGSKRAIVYEFLHNGSLDQFISKKKSLILDVSTLYGIALGVARGIEYLHHGCKTRIVHFDIKPQNVLLDDNLCPKVSDFGLAKLCEKRESILSLLDARGTIGYIAPEVFSRMYGKVSHKSDVYSYGMLMLEMMDARNKEIVETAASNASSTYFPDWTYKDLESGEYTWNLGDEITREEKEIAKKMIMVGLWCIQPCPSDRPPMNKVVEMMERSLDALDIPPKPSLQSTATALPSSSSHPKESVS